MYRTINIFLHNEVYGEEQKKLINDFKKKYKEARQDLEKLEKRYYKAKYFFKDDKYSLKEIYHELMGFEEYIDVEENLIYSDEDMDRAVAYGLLFSTGFEEYENYLDREELELDEYPCTNCIANDRKEILYAKPYNISKFKKDYGIYAIEAQEEQILTPNLHQFLVDNNISQDYFRPVYTSKNKLISYYLYQKANVLPRGSVKRGGKIEIERCENCGREIWRFLQDDYEGDPPIWTITKEGLNLLKDVNTMEEYIYGIKRTIISKKLYNLLKKKMKNLDGENINIVPIFLKE